MDRGVDVVLDDSNNVVITGWTTSTSGIASTGAYQTSYAGGTYDAFIAKFSNTGGRQWSSYYGAKDEDAGQGIALDDLGNGFVTGWTISSKGMATSGAYQTSNGGGSHDGFIAKFSGLAAPKCSLNTSIYRQKQAYARVVRLFIALLPKQESAIAGQSPEAQSCPVPVRVL